MSKSIPQATAAARAEQRQTQEQLLRSKNLDLSRFPVTAANEAHWRKTLWAVAVIEPQATYVTQTIAQILALTSRPNLDLAQSKTVEMAMQVGTQLYLSNPVAQQAIAAQFQRTIQWSTHPKWVAMAISALARTEETAQLRQLIQERFPTWNENVDLDITLRDIAVREQPPPMPPLVDLLTWRIPTGVVKPRATGQLQTGQLQMYVFCQRDRGLPCSTYLKNPEGQFLRQGEQLWTVPLLLRSLHDLAWNFSRGQTPQGIYRIEGLIPQPDTEYFRAYGQFGLVKLFVPFEPGVREFLPGQPGPLPPGLSAYQALLPPSWRNYFPIQQSYWAGRVGRGLFRIHGSGEAPSFFSNNRRFPGSEGWNPAIGCLSALELYDDSGRLQTGDMPRILRALGSVGGDNFTGYLIVVDVPPRLDISALIQSTVAPVSVQPKSG